VTVNKRTVQGQPYVANTTTNVIGVDVQPGFGLGGAGIGSGLGLGGGIGLGGLSGFSGLSGLGGIGGLSGLSGSYLGGLSGGSCLPAAPLCL
jgi:hypothetical protein